MQTAGARVLQEDEHDLSREAVLLQWERKIEAAERRPSRAEREASAEEGTVEELRPTEDATHSGRRRFERRSPAPVGALPEPKPSAARSPSPVSPQRRGAGVDDRQPRGPARPDRPVGLPAGPLPGGRGRRDRARLRAAGTRTALLPQKAPLAGVPGARRHPTGATPGAQPRTRLRSRITFGVEITPFSPTLTAGKSYAEREAR